MQQVIPYFNATLNDLSTQFEETQLYEAVHLSDIESIRFLLNQNGVTSVNTLCRVEEIENEDEEDEEDEEEPGYESPLTFAERRVEEGADGEDVEDAELAKRIQIVEVLVASGGLNVVQTRAQYLLEHPAAMEEEEDDVGENQDAYM